MEKKICCDCKKEINKNKLCIGLLYTNKYLCKKCYSERMMKISKEKLEQLNILLK